MILPINCNNQKNNNLNRHTMSEQNKPKNKKTKKAIKTKNLYADFIDQFGKVPEKQLLGAMIHNFVEALDFITYHGLFNDFEMWIDDPQLYKIMLKTKAPYMSDEN